MSDGGPDHGTNGMTRRDMCALIDTFMHYCPQDVRGKLIAECPQAYNRFCGYKVVKVVHVSDGREVNA